MLQSRSRSMHKGRAYLNFYKDTQIVKKKKKAIKDIWQIFTFLMMMWYEYINKTSVKASFCFHCYIPRMVCNALLMQTAQALTVCENAKELTEKQSEKDWSYTHCTNCRKCNMETANGQRTQIFLKCHYLTTHWWYKWQNNVFIF